MLQLPFSHKEGVCVYGEMLMVTSYIFCKMEMGVNSDWEVCFFIMKSYIFSSFFGYDLVTCNLFAKYPILFVQRKKKGGGGCSDVLVIHFHVSFCTLAMGIF